VHADAVDTGEREQTKPRGVRGHGDQTDDADPDALEPRHDHAGRRADDGAADDGARVIPSTRTGLDGAPSRVCTQRGPR
jgi:hypothetical protein